MGRAGSPLERLATNTNRLSAETKCSGTNGTLNAYRWPLWGCPVIFGDPSPMQNHSAPAASTLKLPFYRQLYFQVVLAIALGVLLGHF